MKLYHFVLYEIIPCNTFSLFNENMKYLNVLYMYFILPLESYIYLEIKVFIYLENNDMKKTMKNLEE